MVTRAVQWFQATSVAHACKTRVKMLINDHGMQLECLTSGCMTQ